MTKTEVKELDKSINKEDDVWIPQLVTRDSKEIKIPDLCKEALLLPLDFLISRPGRGGRQVAITMRNMSSDRIFNCSLAVHRIDNDDGRGNYLGERGRI